MTRLVFIHGQRNEKRDREDLKRQWHEALKQGWEMAGIAEPQGYSVELPYYGDVLHKLTDGAPNQPGARRRGPEDIGPQIGDFEQEYYKLLQDKLKISEQEVAAELPPGVRERGVANWEWVQAIARVVEKRSKLISEFGLGCVPQTDGYLDKPHVQRAVNDIVRPELNKGKTVIVSHSLGTIVTYLLLKELSGSLDVQLFATVGSPLGILAIVRRMKPIISPAVVREWINATDERDYVALVSRLEPPAYPSTIVNINNIRNAGDDAHAITEYLKNGALAHRIAAAL